MLLNKLTVLDKGLFFLSNILIIALNSGIQNYAAIFVFFFLIFISMGGEFKKKLLFFFPGMIFFLITFLASGIKSVDYELLFRVAASLTATGIFIIDISFKELCLLLKKLRIPDFLGEIMIYMFKFATLMLKNSREVKIAIENRGGFRTIRNSHRDTTLLFKGVFQKIHKDMENFNSAMYSRGYSGDFPLYPENSKLTLKKSVIFIGYVSLFTLILRSTLCSS